MSDYDEMANIELSSELEKAAHKAMYVGEEDRASLLMEAAERLKLIESAAPSLTDLSLSEEERREVAMRAYRNDAVFSMAVDMVARRLTDTEGEDAEGS